MKKLENALFGGFCRRPLTAHLEVRGPLLIFTDPLRGIGIQIHPMYPTVLYSLELGETSQLSILNHERFVHKASRGGYIYIYIMYKYIYIYCTVMLKFLALS